MDVTDIIHTFKDDTGKIFFGMVQVKEVLDEGRFQDLVADTGNMFLNTYP